MIYVKDLKKDFGELHVLKGVNQHIAKGEKVVVIGPSALTCLRPRPAAR